jgi:hypothetical protein
MVQNCFELIKYTIRQSDLQTANVDVIKTVYCGIHPYEWKLESEQIIADVAAQTACTFKIPREGVTL